MSPPQQQRPAALMVCAATQSSRFEPALALISFEPPVKVNNPQLVECKTFLSTTVSGDTQSTRRSPERIGFFSRMTPDFFPHPS